MPLVVQLASSDASGDDDDRFKTFAFADEGHTLGNVLKSIVGRYADVEFCGYTVPHPDEPYMHLRIQTARGVRAIDVLQRGLRDLEAVCDHTIDAFAEAFEAAGGPPAAPVKEETAATAAAAAK